MTNTMSVLRVGPPAHAAACVCAECRAQRKRKGVRPEGNNKVCKNCGLEVGTEKNDLTQSKDNTSVEEPPTESSKIPPKKARVATDCEENLVGLNPIRRATYLRPESAPNLTLRMLIFNESTLAGFIRGALTRQHLEVFKDSQWLTDTVVDNYLELICRRSVNENGYLKVYRFESAFYSLLSSENGNELVRETTENNDIFLYDMAFIPVCVKHHWRLGVVNFHNHSIIVYNSLEYTRDLQIPLAIEQFLRLEFARKHPDQEPLDWNCSTFYECTPQQNNGSDCGLFILQFADYLSRGQPFDFGCEHMPYFRQRMLFECAAGQLLSRKQLE